MTGLVSTVTTDPVVSDSAIDPLDAQVLQIFELVHEAVRRATEVFLHADRAGARAVVQRDQLIDALHDRTERAVVAELGVPGGLDVDRQAWLLMIFRILPELERSGDLAEHIASHAAQGLAKWLTPRGRHLVEQMGTLGAEMWKLAADAYAHRDPAGARRLRVRDDEIDDLHVNLTTELAASGLAVPVAIEMALVARYFERLGDHAVNVTRRMQQVVSHLKLADAPT
jgi:phosphate transport system protein